MRFLFELARYSYLFLAPVALVDLKANLKLISFSFVVKAMDAMDDDDFVFVFSVAWYGTNMQS